MNRRQFLTRVIGLSTMSQTYHDPIETGAPANASTFNDPLGDLDAAVVALDNRVDSLIISSGTSDAETIAARGGYTILHDRLDEINLEGNTFYVDATFTGLDAAGRYTHPAYALADCTGGETIRIAPGVYTGGFTVADDGITIIGSGAPYYDSGTGRLVGGTVIRGRIQLNSVVGVTIHNLGVDLYGVDGTDCIAGSTIDVDLHRRFDNLTLLGNGHAALAHGIYCAGNYNEVHNVRIYNCYHGIAVHGSYTNISNVGFVSCDNNAIIVKAKSGVNCLHVNISNITMYGEPASSTAGSGPITLQTEDSDEVRYVNVSNVTAQNCILGAVFINRNDNTGTISECSFTNIVSDGNLGSGSVGDFWMDSGDNIIFTNCRSTNRTAGYGFNVAVGDNVGDVYVYGSYSDATASGAKTGTFKFVEINGVAATLTTTGAITGASGFRTLTVTLANDAFTDFAFTGQGMLMCSVTSGALSSTAYLLASFRANATPSLTSISAGSAAEVGTTAITGSGDGTNSKFKVACTSGHIFILNRLGSTISFSLLLMA